MSANCVRLGTALPWQDIEGTEEEKKEQDIEAFFSQHFQDPKRNRVSVPLPTARKVGGSFAQATKVFLRCSFKPSKVNGSARRPELLAEETTAHFYFYFIGSLIHEAWKGHKAC